VELGNIKLHISVINLNTHKIDKNNINLFLHMALCSLKQTNKIECKFVRDQLMQAKCARRRIATFLINPLTPELNPSVQRCLTRYFTGDFAS
jgi:hypothetical protein